MQVTGMEICKNFYSFYRFLFFNYDIFTTILQITTKTKIPVLPKTLAIIGQKNMPQLGIEPRTQGFSDGVFIKSYKNL
jgi:hypothetical protein